MTVAAAPEAVIWHDVECGAYGADLPLWDRLAGEASPGAVLELGCGTGRVAVRLARGGHGVTALDRDHALLAALRRRAECAGVEVAVHHGDARRFALRERFALVAAPMQLIQLLDRAGRRAMLEAARRHLAPGGRTAIALSSEAPAPWRAGPRSPAPAPDVVERDGWIYSSLPIGIEVVDGAVVVRRLRQVVSPNGELRERENAVRLAHVSPADLELEAREAGLRVVSRDRVGDTAEHLGSTIVVMEPLE